MADTRTYPVTGGDIHRARAAMQSMVGEATGLHIPERSHLALWHGDKIIAKIEILDDTVWREFAHDLGFRP